MESLFISEKIFTGNSNEKDFLNGGIVVDDQTGKITKILKTRNNVEEFIVEFPAVQKYDFGNEILMPGLIDSHVHINDPGRDSWEDFTHVTKAAAVGGFTTLADMPLNSIPPTTTVENLKIKMDVATDKIYVDVGFWGGVIPNNYDDIPDLVENGLVGFKCFLCTSGVDEFPKVNQEDIENAVKKIENLNTFLAFHAEVDGNTSEHNQETSTALDPTKFQTYLDTRPPELEVQAIQLISEILEKYKK